ncbi:hypothetical protein Gotur_005168 [Gossypium turneri]
MKSSRSYLKIQSPMKQWISKTTTNERKRRGWRSISGREGG